MLGAAGVCAGGAGEATGGVAAFAGGAAAVFVASGGVCVGAAAAVFGVVGGVFAGGGSEATGTHGRGAALATTGAMASGRGGLWVWGISFAGGAVLASGGVLIACISRSFH